jgi:hypothetical protein
MKGTHDIILSKPYHKRWLDMNNFRLVLVVYSVIILSACAGTGGSRPYTLSGDFTVIAWNDLGMHCMDGDYSVFSILPPYNNLHAQLVDRTTGKLVSTGVKLAYEADEDTMGSINTSSSTKTNFWDWAFALFGVHILKDMGLAGNPVQSRTPAPLVYDPANGYWKAEGIPVVPYDDDKKVNYYPMVKVAAKDIRGTILATTRTVLPVSEEMTCKSCHSSNIRNSSAQPSTGWVNYADPEKDFRRNILKLHDERKSGVTGYVSALSTNGYSPAGLSSTADSGKPILCANCHASNALGKTGIPGIKSLTGAVHSRHARVMVLDDATDNAACYYCHPGSQTQCLRGIMGIARDSQGNLLLQCQSCHGSISKVGSPDRRGWIDLPSCQHCHYRSRTTGNYVRDTGVFDPSGNMKQVSGIFTTGSNLYKDSAEHGNIRCEACHGSTHAEYPTSEANDNVQSTYLQGYAGTVAECSVCHADIPLTKDGGPHGMHTTGQVWVLRHDSFAENNVAPCAVCHGADYRGTFLSGTSTDRSFRTEEFGSKTYRKRTPVSCYDCHNGPHIHD